MKTKIRVLLVLAGTALLTGCGTQAQLQASVIVTTVEAANQSMRACTTAIFNDPRYAPLSSHVSIDPRDTSLAQLGDDHFATEREIALLFAVDADGQVCRKAYLDQLQTVVQSVAGIVAVGYTKSQNNLLELIKKKQTWGDYAKNRQSIALETFSEQSAEYQRVSSILNQENNAELAQRQAASEAFLRYYQTQQIINNMNRPVANPTTYTNCTQYGNTVNCAPRRTYPCIKSRHVAKSRKSKKPSEPAGFPELSPRQIAMQSRSS